MTRNNGYKGALYEKLAAAVWIVPLLVMCILVWKDPLKHTVTHVYHEAVQSWMAGGSLYVNTVNLYHYFPQFVYVFMPFHLIPQPYGDILWRVAQAGLLAWGVWRMVKLSIAVQNELFFLSVSFLVVIQSLGAFRNGQANVLFAALGVHAAACLARSQWGLATLCLVGALIIKPIAVVMIGLAAVVYRQTLWRVVLGAGVVIAFPFFLADPSYVLSQYRQAFEMLFSYSLVTENRFADLNGLLRALGAGLTGSASQIVRMGAGALTLIVWWVGAQRTREPERAWFLLGLATTYLMLFNPMTESNSYVIVAPIISFYAVRFLRIEDRPKLGWGLIGMILSMSFFPELFRRVDKNFSLWWKPLMMIFFGAILLATIFSRRFQAPDSVTASLPDKPA